MALWPRHMIVMSRVTIEGAKGISSGNPFAY